MLPPGDQVLRPLCPLSKQGDVLPGWTLLQALPVAASEPRAPLPSRTAPLFSCIYKAGGCRLAEEQRVGAVVLHGQMLHGGRFRTLVPVPA